MSRIIVKNLPIKTTESELQTHFSKVGTITEAKIKYRNGESRRFAFIGFKCSEEASTACQQFHNTYIKENKVTVEICKKLNSEATNWIPATKVDNKVKTPAKYNNLFTVVIRTKEQNADRKPDDKKGKTFTKKLVKDFLKPLKYSSLRIPRGISYVAYVGFKTESQMKQAIFKDKSFLGGVRVRITKFKSDYEQDRQDKWKEAKEKLQTAISIEESGKLFVRNLWYSTTEEDIQNLFEKIGMLADVTVPKCKITGKVKGFAHITYVLPENAKKALEELDGSDFQGRPLHILPSLLKGEDEEIDEKFSKKAKQEKTDKAGHNWNVLFLGAKGVSDLVAKKLNKSKYEILSNEGNQSASVTLALGEAKFVEETKRFLLSEGVSLDAFTDDNVERSKTVLLVKQLPANTLASEIKAIFEPYGELGRVVLPPSGLTAIVEFLELSNAKIAYKSMKYTRFKNLPLYLEWAPFKIFSSAPSSSIKTTTTKLKSKLQDHLDQIKDNAIVPVIFVRNIPFESPLSEIRDIFSAFGEISAIRLPQHFDKQQHKGYCFVDFLFKESALNAFEAISPSTHLRGRRLVLEWEKDRESVADLRKRTAEHFLSSDLSRKRTKLVMDEDNDE